MLTANRLSTRIQEVQAKLDVLEQEKREKLESDMDVTFEEHFAFQQAQARAHATGKITSDEAQVIYVALGEVGSQKNGGWAANTSLATKVVVTLAMSELLKR